MKMESVEFTDETIDGFIGDYFEVERKLLIDRLRRVLDETDELAQSIKPTEEGSGDSWNALETLAHMATTAQFFGWLANQVASKKELEGNLIEMLKLRDVVSNDAAQMPVDELVTELHKQVDQTISFLETVDYDDLRTPFQYVGRTMTAEDLVRVPLCAHLESHVAQMREAISRT
jgi:hypothetical protein